MPARPSAIAMACPTRCPAPVTRARRPARLCVALGSAMARRGSELQGDLGGPAAGGGEARRLEHAHQAVECPFTALIGRRHARGEHLTARSDVKRRLERARTAL